MEKDGSIAQVVERPPPTELKVGGSKHRTDSYFMHTKKLHGRGFLQL